ncbi:hypothetical protein GOP47_0014727 [Adiantum capillus-veneris]|uniref:Cyclic nucleotide-binding domain-containing protein n=1 Tax=Adiantum capillus-veneris TaxID=13818 RepID=A0A9D4UM22_ADICA|nr:hypothetical protein GOP47_0014727 [Adiantum capillus-veneris]
MDMELDEVIDFLGCIPLLQQLPAASIQQIAQAVKVKRYGSGDYIAREGETSEGMYFVWKGEAEVNPGTENSSVGPTVPSLKPGDYFGSATIGPVKDTHKADVVAKNEVICLMVGHEKANLLSPASIWCSEREHTGSASVEQVLQLETLEVDLYRAVTLPGSPTIGHVFGGQLLGQALAAASKSVDPALLVHSLHSYFLRTGDTNEPLIYQVQRLRDGHSFATRRIAAIQKGHTIFLMMASFQRVEEGFTHQEPMPSAPNPEELMNAEELQERCRTDPRLPVDFRIRLLKRKVVLAHIDVRPCNPGDRVKPAAREPRDKVWFRARGKLSDDQALQRCVAAYASDIGFVNTSLRPHRGIAGYQTRTLSLDHSMWFHKSFRADEWLLHVVESPRANNARGLVLGKIYTRSGELVVSTAQEGVIRMIDKSKITL